jgi:serine/alanine adding enzyme
VLDGLGLVDAYLRRAYVESACVLEPGEPLLLEHGGAAFALIRRSDPVDAITPYGYGGPVGGDLPGFWDAYDAWCREQDVVTTFVRFHPLYANARDAPIHVEPLAPTIAWRLDSEELEAGMHLNHRRAVRKARNAGVTVAAAGGVGDFVPLYEETMRRANASRFYFFAPEYWQALERTQLVRFDAHLGGEIVASALCLASPPWLHYHLGASSDEGRKTGAMTLLFLEAATWARERGYERFHLGGGVGGASDSLHEFKRRFDPGGLVDAAIGKAVHDGERYARLTGRETSLEGFFPAYRDPEAPRPE